MRVLELFAGARSIGKIAEARKHTVTSVDIKDFGGIDIVKDIEHLYMEDLPYEHYDMVWASPPCTTYSISAISTHRDGQIPKTEFSRKSDRLIANVWRLIDQLTHRNHLLIYYIENPRGMLRKMDFMKRSDRMCVTYCSYGDIRMKPTDIWSNNIKTIMFPQHTWIPRPMCHNGNTKCHHEPAPRGSKTGTQGLKNNHERSKIPSLLCEEIIKATEEIAMKSDYKPDIIMKSR